MSNDEIKALPVETIAADDCVLFMWSTVPHAPQAHAVMELWGFTYKSEMIWDKRHARPGMGYWSNVDHEKLLIGTRGRPPAPAPGTQDSSIYSEPPTDKHSEKPEYFAALIERFYPTIDKIELNARRARPGWQIWGNEAPDNLDIDDFMPGDLPDGVVVQYCGVPTDESDQVIRDGYARGAALVDIASRLGLEPERVGVVKGRAHRLGLTRRGRIAESNRNRKKAKGAAA